MKYIQSLSLVAFISANLAFAQEPARIVSIENVTPDMFKEESIIIQFPAGSLIPLHLALDGNLLFLNLPKEAAPSIYCKETFFVQLNQGELLFSLDMMQWKPFLEFITGTLSCTVSAQNDSTMISLEAIVNSR